ncbi:hypothetical protein BD626DRAFT_566147 [Schizophyllum amplum]|uniref:Uncharacterized protein n=1 Tax=Schizophyllum amplum TaxID=97359 RepID=A0A550CQQ5_9AGAR|nr:hypothetical protein BD626DRAFT_566147 [Auriculariopsis ampla]
MHRVYNWTCDNARVPQKSPYAPPTPANALHHLPLDGTPVVTKSRQRSASMHDTRSRSVAPPKRSLTTPTNPYSGSKHSNSSYTLVQPVVPAVPPLPPTRYPVPPPPQIIYYEQSQPQPQPRRHNRANSYAAPPPPQVYASYPGQPPVAAQVYPYPTTVPRKSTSSAQRAPIVVPQAVPQYAMPQSPKQQPLIKRIFGFGRKNSTRSSSREPSREHERRGSKEYSRPSYDDSKSRSREHSYDEKHHHKERESRHRSSSQHPRSPQQQHHHRSSRPRERRLSY